MNLSSQSREVISQIGHSLADMFTQRFTPLQILILVEIRHAEAGLGKGQHLFANSTRKSIEELYRGKNIAPPTRQAFWDAFYALQQQGLLYIAPHKTGTSKRALALTAKAVNLFTYPKSIHPFKNHGK